MTLPFSQYFPDGEPTCFIPKIWMGLHPLFGYSFMNVYEKHWSEYYHKFGCYWNNTYSDLSSEKIKEWSPKLHTIRKDAKNRWREGMDIHFVINNRTKNRFQFAPILKVKSVQNIEIDYCIKDQIHPIVVIDGVHFYNPKLSIDKGIDQLAKNDGFDSVDKFFNWFSEDFTGKIIHWTNFKYQ